MNLLSLSYWFNTRPEPYTGLILIVTFIFVMLLVIGAVYTKMKTNKKIKVYHRLWDRLFIFFLTNSIVGILLVFFNLQGIPVLMAKFWYLLWLVGFIWWVSLIFRFAKTLPKRKEQLAKEKEFNKYIP